MPIPSQTPLEATILPDAPQRGGGAGRSWIVACGIFLVFVGGFAALIWGLGRLLARSGGMGPSSREGSLVEQREEPQQRLAAVKAALEADEMGCTAAEKRELTRLLSRLDGRPGKSGVSLFRELVDFDALADRVVHHPLLAASARIDRARVRRQLEGEIYGPPGWVNLRVVHVTKGSRGDEALVYAIGSTAEGDAIPVRWWLRRSGRTWRICDWERIDMGYSEAARRALKQALVVAGSDSTYQRVMFAINRANGMRDANTASTIVQELLSAEQIEVPPASYDLVQLELAKVWQKYSRPDQVLAACERVRQPSDHCAVPYLRTLAYAELQQHSHAAQAAAEYRRVAGRHPQLLAIEARALEALGQRAEAADCWSQRLELLPDDATALAEYSRLTGDERNHASAPTTW